MSNSVKHLLEVKNLKKYFNVGSGQVLKAIDDVSFYIDKGETFGLVGESGCGKSTTGRTITRLYEATSGEIYYEGKDISRLNKREAKDYTKDVQMIFQDPYASLNPRMTVGDIIAEGIDIHNIYKGKERQERIYELLGLVGLNQEHANRFPHEFSGGQRQRIGIARALAIEPKLIICDEPISALDVSIQAQVVNLLEELQRNLKLTYLFIAHDLSMVKHISDRVGVMYLGSIVEMAPSAELYKNSMHPYTGALMSAIPIPDPDIERSRQRILLEGDVPSPINPPAGCKFASRCKHAMPICKEKAPELVDQGGGHFVACYLYNK
ncbi:ABC transporter ATP-binding protein [Xylanivirga thermophila]|jgi:oligopeptide transport system ATP-binding protein|uniref:ABC transporter ATP-binding protein n=1 Tax=Xylanivirga thermophila TaxID=2496273 RepID=UPI00101CD6E8|nr:oligopeptide/dipeptide ABC transporter ATP-binding protein [Xylanivirga thermophila]